MNNNQKKYSIDDKQTKRNLIFYPIGTLGRDMVYSLFTNFIFLYVLFTRNLTTAQLMAITGIMIGARIFDALNDPIMGNIIERTRTRWGKFKPWMIIGIVTTCIVVYLAFNVRLEGWAFIWFFGVIYFSYSITYTMHDISYWGMLPALGSEKDTRDKLTARTNLVAGIGAGLAGLFIPMFTAGSKAIGGNTQTAYGTIALLFCILAPLFFSFTIFGVKEDRSYMNKPGPEIKFHKIVTTITGNDQLMWISLIFLLQQIGGTLVMGGLGSTFVYFRFGYDGGLYSLFSTIGLSASGVLLITYPWLSSKWRRKELIKAFGIVAFFGYMLMLVAGFFLDGMLSFWLITIGYMLSQLGQNCFYIILMISIMNTVEYNEYKKGARDEAIIASLRPFLTKFTSAIVVLLTTLTYLVFGVTNYTNQISTLEKQTSMGMITETEKLSMIHNVLSQVHIAQSNGLLVVMSVVPGLMLFIGYKLYKKYYILDEEEYDRIVEEIRAGN